MQNNKEQTTNVVAAEIDKLDNNDYANGFCTIKLKKDVSILGLRTQATAIIRRVH